MGWGVRMNFSVNTVVISGVVNSRYTCTYHRRMMKDLEEK